MNNLVLRGALTFLIGNLWERDSYINFIKEKLLTEFYQKKVLTV